MTASLGVGSFDPQCDDSPEALFKRVDNALYQAKAEGRDRIVLADFA
ncbi:diguanylate cyclase [Pseudomonas sp. LS44]|nr:diguanylate cyclase [Pseudomonas sp. LS44]UVE19794.1 diguanylate cyclase [Pseudomonas sp. LS44]